MRVTDDPASGEQAAGQRLGPYELVTRLGVGGTGEVWEAILHGPAGFRKAVALKRLKPGLTTQGAAALLAREARLGALLEHPNVVSTLGLSEIDGAWCLILELVRGPSVTELLRRTGGRLPARAVVDLGSQVAAALHAVHTLTFEGVPAGLVHRDVKPGNLLVDRTGLVKLADLGISALPGEMGAVAGTPAYMAPEQFAGRAEARSDLFSLGAVLYHLASGVRPFDPGIDGAERAEQVEARLATPAFLARADAATPGLGAVLHTCMRADPGRRFDSARALRDALATLRARQPDGPSLLDLLVGSGTTRSAPPAASTSRPPADRTRERFVGRHTEVAALEALVRAGERWIVVTGLGGMGKTRLVAEVATRHTAAPVAVDLTGVRDALGVGAAVEAALGLHPDREDPVARVGRALAGRGETLLVLDGLELCREVLPHTVERWLEAAPKATFLGTSRVALGAGERGFTLGPLSQDEAEALLLSRAPRPVPHAERTEVHHLCGVLEGMPLAIELCAARLSTLSVAEVRARLGFHLLAGDGDGGDWQRSVPASLRWSFELLSPLPRSALGQLSVFVGGFGLEAAEAVVDLDERGWVFDVLQDLVDASLLQVDAGAGRFRLHRLVHAYAAESAPPADRALAEVRHGRFFGQAGQREALEALDGPGGPARYQRLAADRSNLMAACRRATTRGDLALGLDALRAAAVVLRRDGPFQRLLDLTTQLLARAADPEPLRGEALLLHAIALQLVGRPTEASAPVEAALALAEAHGDPWARAACLQELAVVDLLVGRRPEARPKLEAAIHLRRALGDVGGEAQATGTLGRLDYVLGRHDEATTHLARAIALARSVGHRDTEARWLEWLGLVHLDQGRLAEAQATFGAALAWHREIGSRGGEGALLGHLGMVHWCGGRGREGLPLLERALALHRAVGNRRSEAAVLVELSVVNLVEAALDAGARAVALARSVGAPVPLGKALQAHGEALRRQGRTPAARTDLLEAEGLLRAERAPHGLADTLVSLGYLSLPAAPLLAQSHHREATALVDRLKLAPDTPLRRELARLQTAIRAARLP